MTTAVIDMREAKSQLSELVDRACAGEDVVISRNGKPAVRLVPVDTAPMLERPIGSDGANVVVPDSFFDPLPDDLMKAFE